MTHEEVVDWLHYTKEKVWRECDARTRSSRLLTKEISVIDMANFSIFGGDSRFYKCLGDASNQAIYYPASWKNCVDQYPSYFRFLQNIFGFYAEIVIEQAGFVPLPKTRKRRMWERALLKAHERGCIFPRFL